MSDSGIQTATGDGEWLFPSASTVGAFQFWIDTDTVEVDYLSSWPPRRSMHAGWLGLTSGTEGVAGDTLDFQNLTVIQWWYLDHESNMRINTDGFAFYDRITYHIPPGITVKFIVFYTF